MTRAMFVLAAGSGSVALLLGAFAFEHVGGLAPCPLCLWQRWPHAAAIVAAAAALALRQVVWPLAGAAAMLIGAGIAGYHTGIERGWVEGPAACAGGGGLGGLSGDELLSTQRPADIVLCDEVAWEMLGLSMASWNGLGSLALAALWIAALRAR